MAPVKCGSLPGHRGELTSRVELYSTHCRRFRWLHDFPGWAVESTVNNFEAERAELASLLKSETFGRSANLVKTLNFICEKYFEGPTEDIKEYDIAVHALGRSEDFDPQ